MNGFDVSDTMRAVRAMWEKHGSRMMNGAYAAPIREDRAESRPPLTEAQMLEIAKMWDDGAPTLFDIQKVYGRAQRTIRKILERYATRPVVIKSRHEIARIGRKASGARAAKNAALQLQNTTV